MKPLRTTSARGDRFAVALVMPVVLVTLGTLGYHWIEGWSFFDSLYMTVITLTTVGFREVHELSRAGQVFTICVSLGGVFTLFYFATTVIGALVSGQVVEFLESRRMERSLADLKDHLIVCGFGRMGRLVCQEFSAQTCRSSWSTNRPNCSTDLRCPWALPCTATRRATKSWSESAFDALGPW